MKKFLSASILTFRRILGVYLIIISIVLLSGCGSKEVTPPTPTPPPVIPAPEFAISSVDSVGYGGVVKFTATVKNVTSIVTGTITTTVPTLSLATLEISSTILLKDTTFIFTANGSTGTTPVTKTVKIKVGMEPNLLKLSAKPWRLLTFLIRVKGSSDWLVSLRTDVELNQRWYFYTNGRFEIFSNIKPNGTLVGNGDWVFSENYTKITIGGTVYSLVILNETTMVREDTFNGTTVVDYRRTWVNN